MKKLNQKGMVGAVEILLIVLVIGVLGFVGWRVYDSKSEPSASETNTPSATTEETETEEVANEYLEIPEFGVKIKLTPEIEDAYYVMETNDAGQQYASLSTQSVTDINEGCAADADVSFGMVGYFTDPDATEVVFSQSTTNREAFPDAVMVDGKYYFIAMANQSSCYPYEETSEADRDTVEKAKDVFQEATIEKL